MNPTAKLSPVTVATAIVLASGSGLMAAPAVDAGGSARAVASQQADAFKSVQVRGAALVEAELQKRGYVVLERRRTLLGRNLVRAQNGAHVREIVVHQRTGEILRDVIMPKQEEATSAAAAKAKAAEAKKAKGGLGLSLGLSLGNNASAQGQAASAAGSGNSQGNSSGNTNGADNGGSRGSAGASASADVGADVGGSVGGSVGVDVGGSVGGGFGGGSGGFGGGGGVGIGN